jgi:CheY-like chemotaxis protein
MVMPEMGGKELARELRKQAPDVKILAITGYVLAESLQELRESGFVDVVQKPFEVNTLAKIIHQILAQDETP